MNQLVQMSLTKTIHNTVIIYLSTMPLSWGLDIQRNLLIMTNIIMEAPFMPIDQQAMLVDGKVLYLYFPIHITDSEIRVDNMAFDKSSIGQVEQTWWRILEFIKNKILCYLSKQPDGSIRIYASFLAQETTIAYFVYDADPSGDPITSYILTNQEILKAKLKKALSQENYVLEFRIHRR